MITRAVRRLLPFDKKKGKHKKKSKRNIYFHNKILIEF
jgi:hypothetical protein